MAPQSVGEAEYKKFDKQVPQTFKRLTSDKARGMIDAAVSAAEGWCQLLHRYHSKTVPGATAIATKLQNVKKPNNVDESYSIIAVIRRLLKEFKPVALILAFFY